jgi:hypothetical protein
MTSFWRQGDFEFKSGATSLCKATASADKISFSSAGGDVKISGVKTPSSDNDAASKGYVDSIAAGLRWKDPVRGAVSGNFACSASGIVLTASSNGAFAEGGLSDWAVDERVLLFGQTTGAQNGLWSISTLGDGSNPAILTRTRDGDSATELSGAATFVSEGTAADTAYVMTTDGSLTLGTTSLTFVAFSSGSILGGDGLAKTGNTLSINTDGSSIETNADAIRIKAAGITASHLAADSVTAAALAANSVGSSEIADDSVDSGALAASSVTAAKIATAVCGAGVTGGGGSAIAVGAGNGISVSADAVALSNSFTVSGDITANSLSSNSDVTLKTSIDPITPALCHEKVMQLRPRCYKFISNGEEWRSGFVAQEVQAVCPEFVTTDANGKLGLRYAELTSILCGAIQKLTERVEELEGE